MPPDPVERQAWITLASISGVGPVMLGRAVEAYGGIHSALEALAGTPGADPDRGIAAKLRLRNVKRGLHAAVVAAARDPDAVTRAMSQMGGWVATPFDDDYGCRLHEIEEPPPVLFGIGSRALMGQARSVAVVGTRRPTAVGRVLAMKIATRLVETDANVVSGLAVGIDAAAHSATLDAGGATIAVIGGGLDRPGPAINGRLANRIIDSGGAIVSEQPPGIRPSKGTFPRRNRLISALSLGTIVVEAPFRSGALITARHALEQGRHLLVAPGRPGDPCTAGCLAYLRESPAQPFVGLDEMIVDLELDAQAAGPRPGTAPLSAETALAMLSSDQRVVAEALIDGPQTADTIVAVTGHDAGVVAATLTILQLRGWAQTHGSMQLAAGPLAASRR